MRNTRCPDSKGIKTPRPFDSRPCFEIPDALIQKGLRPASDADPRQGVEIPDALIQKGLRRKSVLEKSHYKKYQMP